MNEETKVDKNYLDAFNLGYELAKELNLKTPMLKDLNSGNRGIRAMQDGMMQYTVEITQLGKKEINQSFGSDNNEYNNQKDEGFDMSI